MKDTDITGTGADKHITDVGPSGTPCRILSKLEKAQIESVEELGTMLILLCHEIGGTDPDGERLGSRDLALAVTHIEDGVARAVRHISQ